MSSRTSLGGSFGQENAGVNMKMSLGPATSKRMSIGGPRMSLAPGQGSKRMSMGFGVGKQSVGPR
jgi:hypothetical protein